MKHTPSASAHADAAQAAAAQATPAGRQQLGLRGKLALALTLAAICTMLVGVVGWLSFQRVVRSQETILAETLPGAEDMHALVRGNARLAALAPQLEKAGNTTEVAMLRANLDSELENMRRRIAAFRNPHVEPALTQTLRQTYARLSDTVIDMTQAVIIRLTVAAERQTQARQHRERISTLGILANVQADNAMARLISVLTALQMRNDGAIPDDTLDTLIDIELDHLERMHELRLAVHLLSSLIERLDEYDNLDRLAQGRAAYLDNLAVLRRRMRNVQDPADREQGLRLCEHLAAVVQDDGAFAMRARELTLRDRTEMLQQSVGQLTTQLDSQAGELILRSGTMLASAANNARKAVSSGLIAFGLTAGALLLVSVLLLWQTLRRHIFSRLKALEGATLSLASGRRDVAIDVSGNDELSSLAQALARFRENALERDRLALALDKERENLEREVLQRTAELRGSNAALAHEMSEHAQARDKAEQASRAKTAFLGMMSHELRTPMSGVLGTLELLEDTLLQQEQRQLTGQIRTSATLLLETLEDMLGYARYEVSRPLIDQSVFTLRTLVDSIFAVQAARAREKGLALTEDIAPDVPPSLVGDRRKLAQVLLNLVGNAIKFTDEGMVEIRVASVRRDGDRHTLAFSVSDSGMGIDPAQQAGIFEPFVQADNGRQHHHGTGLGLAVCRRLVEAMDGVIALDSSPGQGTTVTFTLTLQAAATPLPDSAAAPAPAPQEHTTQTVLLVEDDDATRMIAARFLQAHGHAVHAANSAAQALHLFQQHGADIALLDIHLPDADGFDVMDRLRALPGQQSLPVVLMSAHASDEQAQRLLESGCNAYLAKPFQRDQLLRAIDQACATTAPHGDADFLRQEHLALGPRDMAEIAEAFAAQAQASATALRQASDERNREACRQHAHRLRGASGSVGLTPLAQQAARLETMTASGQDDNDDWQAAAQQLAADIPAAIQWLRRTLERMDDETATPPPPG